MTEKVTEGEADVLSAITENPSMTQATMAIRLSVSRRTIAARLNSLKDKGIIYREGSDKKGVWIIVSGDGRG